MKIKIIDKKIENEIVNFFCLLYHSKDKQNRNNFKLGPCIVNQDKIEVIIYAKPKNDFFNSIFHSNEFFNDFICDENPYIERFITLKENTSCGGFRIKWNILKNNFVYICSSNIQTCGCSGGPCLYISHDQEIKINDEYSTMVEKTKNHINLLIKNQNGDNYNEHKKNKDAIIEVYITDSFSKKRKIQS